MSERRFTDKPDLDPAAVMELAADHPAMVGNRTLFPSTVVAVDDNFEDRLLVSDVNSRKLGKTVEKGKFKGYEIYSLTLEERATCPSDCNMRSICYGNSMHLARRHRIDDLAFFATLLEDEIREILDGGAPGILIRLHVLGDFPSVEYVNIWKDILEAHPNVAVFGYTHWNFDDPIYDAIDALRTKFKFRFAIRDSWLDADWSDDPDDLTNIFAAYVIDEIPAGKKFKGVSICPAQTDATACCATCAYCWESDRAVAFIKHGRAIPAKAAEAAMPAEDDNRTRPIEPLVLPKSVKPADITLTELEFREVAPTSLRVEAKYQRNLGAKSIHLIRKIVSEWDWAKYKPPIVSETEDGLFVIDGQHTAIAAATHPDIDSIHVIVVSGRELAERASAFVAHNKDRINMSPFELIHAERVAGNDEAIAIFEIAERVGATIPRAQPSGKAAVGAIVCVSEVRRIYARGEALLERVLRIAVMASCHPITTTVACALRMVLTEPLFAEIAKMPDTRIADALHGLGDFELVASRVGVETGRSRYSAGALLIRDALTGRMTAEAAE